MEERGDNYEGLRNKLEENNSHLKLLEKVSYNLKVIDVKKSLLAKVVGFIFEVTKLTEEGLKPV